MNGGPFQVLVAARRPAPPARAISRLVVAGAGGALGNEVIRRLVGRDQFDNTEVLAREPIRTGLRGVRTQVIEGDPATWPATDADTALVMFDPPRMFHQRERALWTPHPQQLPALAAWLRGSGVRTLAVVLPHAQGRLPEALKRGLASLDEQSLAALGFERLLIIRSAQAPARSAPGGRLPALASWMLSIAAYMVPSSEQPVRAVKVAQFVAAALELAPPGIHVAAPETVWQAAQGDPRATVRQWLAA
ncbi:hypothetical protein [Ramlibacter sp.]|uniref:hypothetical protein n=1 Tax=Ramlibacter sp. TaxID=1917967 RepID=UPI002BFE5AB1|nr:hypothetical protein [Ramlibacter sp.]HWI81552.1 hypothetical protein [Ramlibacter sp.]